ncbi:hypothetical protein ACIBG8_09190 [Nonomuraea sp. NPDC050556]|uniref:hypothetical protein n=1 Tax=Nonomuraea sp. NPDC050556 TaxID=3364369 RepID=UPI0037B0AD6B
MTVTEYAAALPTPLREIGETLTTLVDQAGRLRPASRQMAAVKLSSLDDIDAELSTTWVRMTTPISPATTGGAPDAGLNRKAFIRSRQVCDMSGR